MTTHAVYKSGTGELVSSTHEVSNVPSAAELSAKGLESKDTGIDTRTPAQFKQYDWNTNTRTFDEVDSLKGFVRNEHLFRAFTALEVLAILRSSEAVIVDGLEVIRIRGGIELDDPATTTWFTKIVQDGILTATRANAIVDLVRRP